MARMKEKEPSPQRTMVAAAGALTVPKRDRKRRSVKAQAWQNRAWGFYDRVGELRYAVNWFSNALARADLYIARRMPDGSLERVTDGPGNAALRELLGETSTKMLKLMGQHYFLAGEWYVIGREVDGVDTWDVFSTEEVKIKNGKWTLSLGDSVQPEELDDDDAIIRLWVPHPKRHGEPDSPVRAVLDDLEEIQLYTAHIRAQILSRLAGAGILVLPSEMTFSSPPAQDGQVHQVSSVDDFMEVLARTMATPIEHPDDPSAIVPIIIQAPGDVIGSITHLKFWSELDTEAAAMREKAIARFALGVDLPPEVVTGTSGANHWGAWAIEESTIKAHIEPALEIICAELTADYLRPLPGVPDDLVIHFDTTDLKLRPNRSKEALELYDRGELSSTALRRETGFTPDDAPDEDDLKRFILMTMAKGSATPEMVASAAKMLGIEGIEAEGDYMREERPAPSLLEHPSRDLPPEVTGALEAVTLRAMERAGNKMKNNLPRTSGGVASVDLYRHVKVSQDQVPLLLDDAFSTLDRLVNPSDLEWVEKGLQTYCKRLLRTQEAVSREEMMKCLGKTTS